MLILDIHPDHSGAMTLAPMLVAQPSADRSKNRLSFKALCQQLLKLRADAAAWEDAGSAFTARHDGLLIAHQGNLMRLEIDFLLAVEQRMTEIRLGFLAQDELVCGIRTLAETYLTLPGAAPYQQELIEIFNRHSRVPYDTMMRRKALAAARQIGLDVSAMDGMGIDEIAAAVAEETEKLFASIFGGFAGDPYADADSDAGPHGRPASSQHPRSAARPDGHSRLREIYRALVRRLHPDREPEPQRRQQKTELLQQVNDAYRRGDLLALLDLQVDAGLLTAEERAGAHDAFHHDLVASIRKQLRGLRATIQDVKTAIKAAACPLCHLPRRLTPKGLQKALDRMKVDLDAAIDDTSASNSQVATAHADKLVYLLGERLTDS